MIVKLKQNKQKSDIEVLIEYPVMSDTVSKIEAAIQSVDRVVRCNGDSGGTVLVKVSDIFYIESVEKRVFVYGADTVFGCDAPLYILMERLQFYGFVQISKSCILNLHTLASVKPIFNAKMEATLTNGEKLVISRNYLPQIKRKLESLS
jgi:DNA-binding LytR/AlgR family response regulator